MIERPPQVRSVLPLVLSTLLLLPALARGAEELAIGASSDPAEAGVEVIFVFSPEVRNEGDEVAFDFGDDTTGEVEWRPACTLFGCRSIGHIFAAPGVYLIQATGKIGGEDVAGSLELTVVDPTSEGDLFVPTAGHLTGYANAQWRTDLVIHNPGVVSTSYDLYLLVRNQDNTVAPAKASFMLSPGRSVRYQDVVKEVFDHTGAAAIRIVPTQGEIMAVSRTYAATTAGTYGQFVPATARDQGVLYQETGRLIGAIHATSLTEGFRTNLGLVNLRPIPIEVEARFFDQGGTMLGSRTYELLPYSFRQEDRVFSQVTSEAVDNGFIELRTLTSRGFFLAYLSVVDNLTRDPVFIPMLRKP